MADDTNYYPPTTPAASAPSTPGFQAAPAAAGSGPTLPDAQSPSQSPYPTAERWVRRSQNLRAASARDGVPKPDDAYLPPLPPAEGGSAPQPAAQFNASNSFVPYSPSPAADGIAQRPSSPAQMPGGTQFRANPQMPLEAGQAPQPEKVKRPGELPRLTQIMPYIDYEPDPQLAKNNPCENQCPTPDGKPCKTRDGRILDCPQEIALSEHPWQPRTFAPSVYAWQASNICYQPLYFEDPQLERYGHSWPFFVQPIVSSVRFTVQSAGLPYQMVIDPCCSDVYPLGFYRPGECSPKLIYQVPLNLEAALVEAGALTGVYFLFPHSAWAYATPGVK